MGGGDEGRGWRIVVFSLLLSFFLFFLSFFSLGGGGEDCWRRKRGRVRVYDTIGYQNPRGADRTIDKIMKSIAIALSINPMTKLLTCDHAAIDRCEIYCSLQAGGWPLASRRPKFQRHGPLSGRIACVNYLVQRAGSQSEYSSDFSSSFSPFNILPLRQRRSNVLI